MPSSEDDFPEMEHININITENFIRKLFKEINPNKSPSPVNLGPRVLKELANDIAPVLLPIFKKFPATGEVPQDWRMLHLCSKRAEISRGELSTNLPDECVLQYYGTYPS